MRAIRLWRIGATTVIVVASFTVALAFGAGSASALNVTGSWLITEHCQAGECPPETTQTLVFELTQAQGSSVVTGTEKSEGPRCPPGVLGEKLPVENNSVLEFDDSLCGTLTGNSFDYFLPGGSEVGNPSEYVLFDKIEVVATLAADETSFTGTYKRIFSSGPGEYSGTITATQTTTPFGTGSSPTAGGTPTPTPTPAPTPPGPPVINIVAAKCVVPKLKGLTVSAAEKALAKAHCGVGKVKKNKSKHVKKGRVISGNEAAGRSLPAGTKVTLDVSRGR